MKKLIVATLIGTSSLTALAAPRTLMSQLVQPKSFDQAVLTKMSQAGKDAVDSMVARFYKTPENLRDHRNNKTYTLLELSQNGRGGVVYSIESSSAGGVRHTAFSIPESATTPKSMKLEGGPADGVSYTLERNYDTPAGQVHTEDTWSMVGNTRGFVNHYIETENLKLNILKKSGRGHGNEFGAQLIFGDSGKTKIMATHTIHVPPAEGEVVGAGASATADRIKLFIAKDDKIEERTYEVILGSQSSIETKQIGKRSLTKSEVKQFGLTQEVKFFQGKGQTSNKSAGGAVVREEESAAIRQAQ